MKQLINLLALISVGCGSGSNTGSAPSAISDSVSIVRSGDDYSVMCQNGTVEMVNEADILTNNVCPNVRPSEDREMLIPGSDIRVESTIFLGREQWYKGGYVNFELTTSSRVAGGWHAKVIDGDNRQWLFSRDSQRFVRLKTPVRVEKNRSRAGTVGVSEVFFTQIETKIPVSNSINQAMNHRKLTTIGQSFPGVRVSFLSRLKIYDNYESGIICGNLRLTSRTGRVSLNSESLIAQVKLEMPIDIWVAPECISSTKPEPESRTKDFDLTLSNFQLHGPAE